MSSFFSFLPKLFFVALGCGMVLNAGRMEAAGQLEQARRRARQGGFLAFIGALIGATGALMLPQSAGHATQWAAGLVLGAGGAALLAGLSGKPRPTGWAAIALLLAGVVVALWAVR